MKKYLLNTFSFIDNWLFKYLSKKSLILFCSPSPPPPPEPIDVFETTTDYAKAVRASLPDILATERAGRPEFVKLELADIESALFGADGQRGILDLTREAGERIREEELTAKRADLATLDEFGTTVSERLRGLADPDADRIARAQADQAMRLFETAESGPTPEQIRNITQGVLGGVPTGNLNDTSTLARQFLARDQFARANREEARKAGAIGFQQAQTLGGDPLKFIFGDPSQALRFGSGAYGQGFQFAQTEQGPQLADYDQGVNLALQQRGQDMEYAGAVAQSQSSALGDVLGLVGTIGSAGGSSVFGKALGKIGSCWVAREVYGIHNPKWLMFRNWLLNDSPNWFRNIYIKYGERFAKFISNKPFLKNIIRKWMNTKIK